MVENLNTIYLIDKWFTFYQRKKSKFIYQNQNDDTNELIVLELGFLEKEKRITKIDIYTYKNASLRESIHITKGIDDIIQIDYYPVEAEMVNIDNKKRLCNINIFKTYSIEDENIYEESSQLILNRKGYKKKKILTSLSLTNHLYVTEQKSSHYIFSASIEKLNRLTKSMVTNILEVEKQLFQSKKENNTPENILVSSSKLITDIELEYPDTLFLYDRDYKLMGVRNQAVIYRNTEDNIREFEIYFTDDRERIKQVQIIEYEQFLVEGIESNFKTKVIKIVPNHSNNTIETNLYTSKSEYMLLNDVSIQKALSDNSALVMENDRVEIEDLNKVLLDASAMVDEYGKIEKMNLSIKSKFGKLILTNSKIFNKVFIDKNNNEYRIASNSYGLFRSLISEGFGIITRLEKNLIKDKNKNLVLMKK